MPTRGVAHADEAAAMGALRAEVSDLHGQLAEKARDIEELESMLRVEITQGLQNIKDSEAMAAQVEERDREIADLRAQLSSSGPGRGGPGVGAGGRRGKATAQLEDKHRKTEAELLRTKQLHSEAKEQAKKAEAEARRHKKKASEFKAELKDAAAERDAAQEALQRVRARVYA
jgi:DNA repair exonuclease SbcCD ATPase subunit